VYPEAVKREILKFRPQTTGYFRIALEKPGPAVKPPLKIKLEYGSDMNVKSISDLEQRMISSFKENLRISPEFIWLSSGKITRETKKTRLVEIEKKK
jgi:phenylacetate-CoA ligase